MASKKTASLAETTITISGPLYEMLKLDISEADFKNYKKNGIPDESDDDYEELSYELMDADGDSGLECSDLGSISLSVNGVLVKNFEKSLETDFKREISPVTRWKIGKSYLVQYQCGADAEWTLKIKGEFDASKLEFQIQRFEIPGQGIVNQLTPIYEGKTFEYEDGSGFSGGDLYLIDKNGKTT